jgi:protein ImuB
MPFACIFVPDFSAEAIVRAEPDLREQAVAVLEGKPPLEKICAVNEEARHAGIVAGMTRLQAELCDEAVMRDRSEAQETMAHQALLDCAMSFSPRVEDAGADTVLLDLSGLEKLFGSVQKIVRQISRRAADMGLEVNVAAGPTLEAAMLAAHGFSGVSIVPEGKEAEFLGGLSVEVLFADEAAGDGAEDILETFRRWGVRKCRDMVALPEVELSERLGQRGLELQRKARGVGTRILAPSDSPLIFEEVMELEFPLVLLEPLAFLLSRMLEQLCARLDARALAAQELRLELTLENGSFLREPSSGTPGQNIETTKDTLRLRSGQASLHEGKQRGEYAVSNSSSYPFNNGRFQRTIHLPVPLRDAKTFLKLLQLDLKSHPPGAPVTKVRLRMEPAKPRPSQNGLFIPSSPEPEKLELTLARISGVVGEGRVGSPELLDTHRRKAFEMRHFTPSLANLVEWQEPKNLVTALRIFRPAVMVVVAHEGGRPTHVSSQARARFYERDSRKIDGEVLWAAGPWRSSGDWWEEDAWVRDEWDIAVQERSGIVLYRLVHDLVGGEWMVEGSYD